MSNLPKWMEAVKANHAKVIHTQEFPRRCGQCWEIEALKIAMEALDMTTGFCVDFRLNQKDWKDHPDVAKLFAYIDSQKRRISELGK